MSTGLLADASCDSARPNMRRIVTAVVSHCCQARNVLASRSRRSAVRAKKCSGMLADARTAEVAFCGIMAKRDDFVAGTSLHVHFIVVVVGRARVTILFFVSVAVFALLFSRGIDLS